MIDDDFDTFDSLTELTSVDYEFLNNIPEEEYEEPIVIKEHLTLSIEEDSKIAMDLVYPIEHKQYPGFYIIPGIEYINYIISKDLDVITLVDYERNRKAGDIVPNQINKRTGFISTNIKRANGGMKPTSTKQLLKLAMEGPINYRENENLKVTEGDIDFVTDHTKLDIYIKRIEDFPTKGSMSISLEYKKSLIDAIKRKCASLKHYALNGKK